VRPILPKGMAIRVSKELKGPVTSKICTSGKARNPTRRVLGAIGGVFGLYAGRCHGNPSGVRSQRDGRCSLRGYREYGSRRLCCRFGK
jgi:hypothetical protein